MSYTFNAAPMVVKSKAKYRPANTANSTKLTPLELENAYVKEQEEKIKSENMQK
jgi:hypothetical protein